jgi:hypothetical protein
MRGFSLPRLSLLALAAFGWPAAARAQALPADCSVAPVPAQPVTVSVAGVAFAPKSIKLSRGGGIKSDNDEFEGFTLSLRSADDISPPLEAEIKVIVRKGQTIDGRVFRRLPTKETGRQPSPIQGLPEVQAWSFRNRPAQIHVSFVEYVGSARLELGRRQGNMIDGRIYLCVLPGQTSLFNKTPTKETYVAVGTFTARLD